MAQDEEDLILQARRLALHYANHNGLYEDDDDPVTIDEMHVIYIAQVLSNWTILVTTSFESDYLYKVTFDRPKQQTKVEVYSKTDTVVIETI